MSEDFFEEVENAPPGLYKLYYGSDIGHHESSIHLHLSNIQEVGARIQAAIDAGFAIEALSLRLQIIDFWLRVYYRNKRKNGEGRQREFGRLIDQCKKLGMDKDLVHELKEFNRHRVDAIHGYVMGKTTYDVIFSVVTQSKRLSAECISWVLEHSGEVIESMKGRSFNTGDMVLDWRTQINQLSENIDL